MLRTVGITSMRRRIGISGRRALLGALLWAGLLLAACATVTPLPVRQTGDASCRQLFRDVDRVVADAGVRDHGPYTVAGFPYLRIDRFYDSFRDQVGDAGRFSDWVRQLADLDKKARRFELRNLPAADTARLGAGVGSRLDRCRQQLLRTELARPKQRARLRRQARVPDGYATWQRVLGLYPLTALFVSAGVRRWHTEVRGTFAIPLARLPVAGTLVRWAPAMGERLGRAGVQAMLQRHVDVLGIPRPGKAALVRLFATFAPVWEVDVANADDRIGTPVWRDGRLSVDTKRPAVFRKLSYTRFHGRVLLQLNYIVWFPARDSRDIYGGRFDGIDWRVTLGPDGKPWLYDAIHNCGCYHEFFPTRHLHLKGGQHGSYSESPLVPQLAPPGQPLVLRISHQTHYIQRVYLFGHRLPAHPMAWRDYDALRSLPDGRGHRSMFGAHGIVPGSERPERFLLWPMGVRSPGAMRQWGRHDTAFVGQRHFDDPYLIQTLFAPVGP
jgi:hypothetical protein